MPAPPQLWQAAQRRFGMIHHSHAASADLATRGTLLRGARFYDLLVTILTVGRGRALRERTLQLAALRQSDAVLEVGCGTGALTQCAHARVGPIGSVYGIDPSAEMVEVAREKCARAGLSIDYRVAGIEALPFPDNSVDVVLSSLMMHHLPHDLKQLGLAEIRRVLKTGGRVVIVDFQRREGPLARLTLSALIHHRAKEGIEDLVPLLAGAGFADLRTGSLGMLGLGYLAARAPA
jgi:ubiquinone/menaquinone biosynthesis C-methylase UbiE